MNKEQLEQLAARFTDKVIACAEIRVDQQDKDDRDSVGIAQPTWTNKCLGLEFHTPVTISQVLSSDPKINNKIEVHVTPIVKKYPTDTRFDLGKVMRVFDNCFSIHANLNEENPVTVVAGICEGIFIRLNIHPIKCEAENGN